MRCFESFPINSDWKHLVQTGLSVVQRELGKISLEEFGHLVALNRIFKSLNFSQGRSTGCFLRRPSRPSLGSGPDLGRRFERQCFTSLIRTRQRLMNLCFNNLDELPLLQSWFSGKALHPFQLSLSFVPILSQRISICDKIPKGGINADKDLSAFVINDSLRLFRGLWEKHF